MFYLNVLLKHFFKIVKTERYKFYQIQQFIFPKTKSPLQFYLADISLKKIWSGNHRNREYSKQSLSSRILNKPQSLVSLL